MRVVSGVRVRCAHALCAREAIRTCRAWDACRACVAAAVLPLATQWLCCPVLDGQHTGLRGEFCLLLATRTTLLTVHMPTRNRVGPRRHRGLIKGRMHQVNGGVAGGSFALPLHHWSNGTLCTAFLEQGNVCTYQHPTPNTQHTCVTSDSHTAARYRRTTTTTTTATTTTTTTPTSTHDNYNHHEHNHHYHNFQYDNQCVRAHAPTKRTRAAWCQVWIDSNLRNVPSSLLTAETPIPLTSGSMGVGFYPP